MDSLRRGTDVEVRSDVDSSWVRGFAVVAHVDRGYIVRRRSDDTVLPAAIADRDVRAVRWSGGLFWE